MPTPHFPTDPGPDDGSPDDRSAEGGPAPDALAGTDRVLARIARDVHDGVGQTLVGASMLAAALAADLGESPHRAEAERLAAVVRSALAELRQFALGLDPIDMADLGLDRALARLADNGSDLFGVTVTVDADGGENLASAAALDVYRIVQEALTNAVRHGAAEHIDVAFHCDANALTLTITDDGRGVADPGQAGGEHVPGMGLRTMRARARRLGGALGVQRTPSGGTIVHVRVPTDRRASSSSTAPR